MIKVLLTVFLISLNAFGIEPYEGGGGVVCNHKKTKRLILVDEVLLEQIYDDELAYIFDDADTYFDIGVKPQPFSGVRDLRQSDEWKEVERITKRWHDSKFAHEVRKGLESFAKTNLSDAVIAYPSGTSPYLTYFCDIRSMALVFYTENGADPVLFTTIWNQLSYSSRVRAILHEALRFYQVNNPDAHLNNYIIAWYTIQYTLHLP